MAYYTGADIISQAVILCVAISQAQAFLDGNKRTAFAVTNTFLFVNDFILPSDIDENIVITWLELSATQTGIDREQALLDFENWLRGEAQPFEFLEDEEGV